MAFDVFLSYAPEDAAWVRVLAGRLHELGFAVFLDEWEIAAGDVVLHAVEEGIRSSAAGVLVFSRAAARSRRVREEYAALLTGPRRLVPVLREDVPLPPFAASRKWVDFRAGADFEQRLAELVAALRGDGAADQPPVLRPEGPLRATLRISADVVELAGGPSAPVGPAAGHVAGRLGDVGELLTRAYLPDPVGPALAAMVDDARGQGAALWLRLETSLGDLPWETMRVPGTDTPLALHPHVRLHRGVPGAGPAPALRIPGPLRVLVALASPGDELDLERELGAIVDALTPARRQARAHVRVLNLGTLAAIRAALTQERFHVLHIACHARAGRLLLEDERGAPHEVTADDLVAALPVDRRPAAMVLAACSTGLSGLAEPLLAAGVPQVVAMRAPVSDRYAARFGGRFYAELALAATPSVPAAVAAARDPAEPEWATPVVSVRGEPRPLYDPADLAATPPPPVLPLPADVPLRPVGDFVGRRAELRALLRPASRGVVLHGIGGAGKSSLAAELLRLRGDDAGLIVPVAGATTVDQILQEFGRALLRSALATGKEDDRRLAGHLRDPAEPWPDRLAVALGRPVTLLIDNFETNLDVRPDGRAVPRDDALAAFLAAWIRTPGPQTLLVTSRHPVDLPDGAHRRLDEHHLGPLSFAETRKLIWRLPGLDALPADEQRRAWRDVGGHPRALEYLDALLRHGRARFADVGERLERLLGDRVPAEATVDAALAESITLTVNDTLLDDLLALLDPAARELLTGAAVHRVPLDRTALAWQAAGPERRPADPERDDRVDGLREAVRRRGFGSGEVALADLGYEPDQQDQLRQDLAELDRPPVDDAVLDETALAVLDGLGLLAPLPGGHLVHRWTAATLARLAPADTARAHRRAAAFHDWQAHRASLDALDTLRHRVEARFHQHAAGDLAAAVEGSRTICDHLHSWSAWDWEEAICRETLSWVPPGTADAAHFTGVLSRIEHQRGRLAEAEALARRSLAVAERVGDVPVVAACRHRLGAIAHDRHDFAAAEEHHRRSLELYQGLGDRTGVANAGYELSLVTHMLGDYGEAERLGRQALDDYRAAGDWTQVAMAHQHLGHIAEDRGDRRTAGTHYRQAAEINAAQGQGEGVARSFHQLGLLAEADRDDDRAASCYRQALDVWEQLGDLPGVATAHTHLGMLAQRRNDPDEARRRYLQALELHERLDSASNVAGGHYQLGMLAMHERDTEEADRRFRLALEISEHCRYTLGVARSHYQLGMLARLTGDRERATSHARQALAIFTALGNEPAVALCHEELGLAGDPAALRSALAVHERTGDRDGEARVLTYTGQLQAANGELGEAVLTQVTALGIHLEIRSPQASVNVAALRRLREVSPEAFARFLTELLDEDSARFVAGLLDAA